MKQFFQKLANSAGKKCWEKDRSEKGRKNVFYIHTNIVTQKMGGGKTRETIFFRNTRIVRAKNVGKKIVRIKGEKTIFIFTRIS